MYLERGRQNKIIHHKRRWRHRGTGRINHGFLLGEVTGGFWRRPAVKGNNTWKEKGKSKPFTTGADGAKEAQVGKDTDF